MKTYEVFAKTDCGFCKKAVDFLALKNVPFIVIVCDKAPDYLQFVKEQYKWETVPIIVEMSEDGRKLIGGSAELEALFQETVVL